MSEPFQKLLVGHDAVPAVLSLNVQAAMGPVRQPERSQLSLLIRHFLELFFNHESTSASTDGKTRLVQLAVGAGLPGFMVAVYLWPVYHPLHLSPGTKDFGPPDYWLQLNHHFFFVLYSFVAMGLITVFEWDLFFPDLLDLFVLGTLPIAERRVFLARVGAIAVFVFGFLFDANFLAPLVLPMATDPPNLPRFLAGHVIAVAASGFFSSLFIIVGQSVLLALVGESLFRKLSLILQGIAVAALIVLLLLFPVLSGVTPAILQEQSKLAYLFPPFWFLGLDQALLGGSASQAFFAELAKIGIIATISLAIGALIAYPLAYKRRIRFLLEGPPPRGRKHHTSKWLKKILHTAVVRMPIRRAVFHFISQTLLRVPRYRIYLVLYGGVGASILIATVLRLHIEHHMLRAEASAEGIRAAIGIVAFWVVAGMRAAFVSAGNQRGSWIFRIVHGNPAHYHAVIDELLAAKIWVWLSSTAVTLSCIGILRLVAPAELLGRLSTTSQLLLAAGLCIILTDVFFGNVLSIPFTGEISRDEPNLAFTLLRYFTFFPFITAFAVAAGYWMERTWVHCGIAILITIVLHLWLRYRHSETVRLHSAQIALEEDEEDFPMKLGLRY